jgi:hypothetical protein
LRIKIELVAAGKRDTQFRIFNGLVEKRDMALAGMVLGEEERGLT